MRQLRTGVTRILLPVLIVALVLLAWVPVMGATTTTDELKVTGYTLENTTEGGNTTDQIHKYNSLTVELNVYDDRPELVGYDSDNPPRPMARLNTGSFTSPGQGHIYEIEVKESNPGSHQWTYKLRFQNLTYTGVGKTFRCDIFYESNDTIPVVSYEFEIHQCVEYVEPPSSETSSSESSSSEPVVKGTGFVLKDASYGQTDIFAGQPFTLSATLLATNGDENVENVTVGITPAKELSLQDGSSLVYIGTVKPNQSVPASFQLVPVANVEEGSYSAVIDIKGVDAKTGKEVAAQVTISIPVVQPERFEIFSTQLPTDLTAGMDDGMGYGTITLVNQGKGAVSNVSVDVVGSGLSTEEGKQYLGHIAGGEQKTADFNMQAAEAGQIKAQVLVTYESARGEQKTLTYDFSINVEGGMDMDDMFYPDFDDDFMMDEQGGVPPWVWVLIAAVVVVGGTVAAVLVLRRRKAKKAAALEDDFDEEDEDGGDE